MLEAFYILCWIVIPLAVAVLATARFKYEAAKEFDRHTDGALSIIDQK